MSDFDLQVKGYGGVEFNSDGLTLEQIRTACGRQERFAPLCKHGEACASMIRGLQVEGPFLNPDAGYRGTGPQEVMHPADGEAVGRLLETERDRVRLFTLAPEQDRGGLATGYLAERGVTISAGHTNAKCD